MKRLSKNLQMHLPKLDWTLVLEECGPLANKHFWRKGFQSICSEVQWSHSLPSVLVKWVSEKAPLQRSCNESGKWHLYSTCLQLSRVMAPECKIFIKQLSSLITDHRKETYSLVASWIKTKISFALLRSAILCIRGTGNHYYKNVVAKINDN